MRVALVPIAGIVCALCMEAPRIDAQSAQKAAASKSSPCTDANFLIGKWDVSRNGRPFSTAEIAGGEGGNCYVTEVWRTLPGVLEYHAVITYNNATGRWDYLAGSPTGTAQRFVDGELIDGTELRWLAADTGKMTRFSFFKLPDGRIREWSRTSPDNGKSWNTDYELFWTKRS